MKASSLGELGRGLLIQWQVIHALILRETRTSFGAHQLGYLWALVAPVGMIGTFGAMMILVGRTAPLGNNIVVYLATGFLPFLFFRSVASSGANAVGANKALLFFPQVHPLDLVLSRTALETATLAVVSIVILGGLSLWHQSFNVDSAMLLITSLSTASLLGCGLGLILCSVSVIFPAIDKIKNLILRPLFWTSGVFFTVNDLPPVARNLLRYNPILHCVEEFRDGWYPEYTARHTNSMYPLYWATLLIFVGLVFERATRRKVKCL